MSRQKNAEKDLGRGTKDWHTIRVVYPLPHAVSGTLLQAIGAVWPEAVIVTDGLDSRHLVMKVPRTHPPFDAAALEDVRQGHEERLEGDGAWLGEDANVESFDGRTLRVSTPSEAMGNLGYWAYTVLNKTPEAMNYLEQEIGLSEPVMGHDGKEHSRLVLSVCWSSAQTPHALRMAAEERAERAEARVAELEGRLSEMEAGEGRK